MFDLYVLVDLKRKEILSPVNILPDSWRSISGLSFLKREEVRDLGWIGYENFGWIPFNDPLILDYKPTNDWFDISKSNIKSLIRKERKERLNELLYFNDNKIALTDKVSSFISLRLLFLLSQTEDIKTTWKFIDGFVELSKEDFIKFSYFVSNYVQSCFDTEKTIIDSIDACDGLLELSTLSLSASWPSTKN